MKSLSIEAKIVGAFAAALVLMLLAGGQMYRSITEYRDTSRLVANTHLVLEAVEDVRFSISALVSSQRTYFITGKEQYLEENIREEVRIRAVLSRISQLTADNPRQQQRGMVLTQLTEERLKLMNNNIALYRNKGFEAARERIDKGSADRTMAELLKQCSSMREEELTLLQQRSAQAERNATQALALGALFVAVTLTGLPLLWWRVRRSDKERRASETLVQESLLLKQISDDLTREDTINKAYGDILTLINHDWPSLTELTQAALAQLDKHVPIMAGVCYLAHEQYLAPISAMGIPLPAQAGGMVQEARDRNELVTLGTIPPDSLLCIATAVGSVMPREIIAVPLTVKNEVVAVLELASLAGFSETDLRIFNRIVPQLGIGINQKKLERDIMERSTQIETANYELQTINEESQALNGSLQILNEELKAQQIEVAESNRRLEEVSRSKSDFLANMSHELRTPLNSVIGFSEVLQDQLFGQLNEKQQEYVNNILISGKHQLSLINDILDLSKVESGKMELELSSFSLLETLTMALTMLREKALKAGIAIHLNLDPHEDVIIEADQRKLKQIIFNLVSNAVKFSPEGSAINISAVKDENFMEITVADSGMGIKEGDIPKLFQPFTQLESVYTKEYEGTGLGLALTRQLVELHGGRVWVNSEFGIGSTFSFTIPVSSTAIEKSPVTTPGSMRRGSNNTVLLIEDDPLTVSSLKNALLSNGFRVLIANNGSDGIALARSDLPDLIILDLIMPGMNGFDVADRLRKENDVVKSPVLVLTSMDLSAANRARLEGKVWQIAEKGSLSTHELISLVEEAVTANNNKRRGNTDLPSP